MSDERHAIALVTRDERLFQLHATKPRLPDEEAWEYVQVRPGQPLTGHIFWGVAIGQDVLDQGHDEHLADWWDLSLLIKIGPRPLWPTPANPFREGLDDDA